MKKLLALILAMLMIVSVLASCGGSSNNNGDDTQNGANGNGEDVENAKPNNGNNQNENNSIKNLKSYVLNNSEYNQTIQKGIADYEYTNSAAFDPHPYAYLAAKGHDVEAIKNGTIECETITYVLDEKPNILYMAVKVYENKIATHYHFGLKLTDTQMETYREINDKPYAEAAFTNDAITTLNKNIIEETCFKMSEVSSKHLNQAYKENYPHLYNDVFMIFKDINPDDDTFVGLMIYRSDWKSREKHSYNKLRVGVVNSKSVDSISYSGGIYYLPSLLIYITNVEYVTQSATIYDIQDFDWSYCSLDFN